VVPVLSVYARDLGDPNAPQGSPRDYSRVAIASAYAVYAIARTLAPESDGTAKGTADAFDRWWNSDRAREVKFAAIDAVFDSADLKPYEILAQLAFDADAQVWPAAYRALVRLGKTTGDSQRPDAVWMRSLPAIAESDLVPERREAFVTAIMAWWAKLPKAR